MAGNNTAQTRTLRRALDTAGSEEKLAQMLGTDATKLAAWISGDEPTPTEIYLRALDIVSSGKPGV